MSSTPTPPPRGLDSSVTAKSDEAFQQKFAGAALGVVWSVIAGFIVLNLDGVWRVMAIAAFFAMGTTAVIMIARAGDCGHYAFGLALSLALASLVFGLLAYFG